MLADRDGDKWPASLFESVSRCRESGTGRYLTLLLSLAVKPGNVSDDSGLASCSCDALASVPHRATRAASTSSAPAQRARLFSWASC